MLMSRGGCANVKGGGRGVAHHSHDLEPMTFSLLSLAQDHDVDNDASGSTLPYAVYNGVWSGDLHHSRWSGCCYCP